MSIQEIIALQDKVPQVKLDTALIEYILNIVEATRNDEELHLGVSPRGALALTQACQAAALLKGREYVISDDVKEVGGPVCAHRGISKTYLHNGGANVTARGVQRNLGE